MLKGKICRQEQKKKKNCMLFCQRISFKETRKYIVLKQQRKHKNQEQ